MIRRTITGTILILLFLGLLSFGFNTQLVGASLTVHNLDTGEDFATIQEAIDDSDTLDGHTILVDSGIYYENVIVHKSVSLVGEDKSTTIIDGSGIGTVVYLITDSITVTGFTTQNGEYGISAEHTSLHTIENNIVGDNYNGIYLYDSLDNRLNDNAITMNYYGFRIDESYDNTLRRNAMTDNVFYNFYFDLWGIIYDKFFIQDIDLSNTVDGKPIYWWMFQSHSQVPTNAGFVVIFSSNDILIENLELTKNSHGVVLLDARYSTIRNVTSWENEVGIAMHVGRHNTIYGNNVTNNDDGIIVESSFNNIIEKNNIENNRDTGIITWDSFNNRFYHNNIIDNTIQVYNTEPYYSINTWDDGYPSGGNYWSDYEERYPLVVDEYQGENQDVPGSDGVWDHPYEIGVDNIDNYPLVEPWTPLPRTIGDLKTEIEELGSEGQIDNKGIVKSLIAKLNVAQRLVDKGKVDEAKTILEDDLIPQVQNLSGIHITVGAADILIQSAEYILSHL